jgi:hypothetical protein
LFNNNKTNSNIKINNKHKSSDLFNINPKTSSHNIGVKKINKTHQKVIVTPNTKTGPIFTTKFIPKSKFIAIPNPILNSKPVSVIKTNINLPKKQMNWLQAKSKFPKLNPFGDADRDGVINMLDCKPFDKILQDAKSRAYFKNIKKKLKPITKEDWERTGLKKLADKELSPEILINRGRAFKTPKEAVNYYKRGYETDEEVNKALDKLEIEMEKAESIRDAKKMLKRIEAEPPVPKIQKPKNKSAIYDDKGLARGDDLARDALKAGRPLKETLKIIEMSNELNLSKEKMKELKTGSKEKREIKLRKIELETELKKEQNLTMQKKVKVLEEKSKSIAASKKKSAAIRQQQLEVAKQRLAYNLQKPKSMLEVERAKMQNLRETHRIKLIPKPKAVKYKKDKWITSEEELSNARQLKERFNEIKMEDIKKEKEEKEEEKKERREKVRIEKEEKQDKKYKEIFEKEREDTERKEKLNKKGEKRDIQELIDEVGDTQKDKEYSKQELIDTQESSAQELIDEVE